MQHSHPLSAGFHQLNCSRLWQIRNEIDRCEKGVTGYSGLNCVSLMLRCASSTSECHTSRESCTGERDANLTRALQLTTIIDDVSSSTVPRSHIFNGGISVQCFDPVGCLECGGFRIATFQSAHMDIRLS